MLKNQNVLLLGVGAAVALVVYAIVPSAPREPTDATRTIAQTESGANDQAIGESSDRPELVRAPMPENSPTIGHVIQFDNGREVSVNLRRRTEHPFYFLPTNKFVDMYHELEFAALSADATAANQLFINLKACAALPATEELLNDLLMRARDNGMIPSRRGDGLQAAPEGFDYNAYARNKKSGFEFCDGILPELRQDYLKWGMMSAYAGNYYGIRFLTEELDIGQESFDLWKTAWEQGHVNAATAIVVHMRRGIRDQSIGDPDLVQTYAWQLIRNKIYDAAYGYSPQPDSRRAEAMASALHSTAGYLSPHEQEVAENLAVDILESSSNCCIGDWPW